MTARPRVRPLDEGLRLRSYRLIRRIGVGADGEVWAATDAQGQQVALKARPREDGDDQPRIFREFERLRTLRIPNVVRVLNVDADQGYVFFTMELARGDDLDRHVQAGEDLAERTRRCAAAGAGVARALAGIHRLGLAHRDIKPANILVDDQGMATVLDFGTSRFGAGADEGLIGTPHYMAPEQRIGLPHDSTVDLYALGVTLHEALSGTPARTWTMGRARTSLALLGPQVPLALAHLVDRLLALDPAARPPAEEAQDLLERVARGRALPSAPWPSPTAYHGDPTRLLDASAVVVGVAGSGCRRLIAEARWQWYSRGYRSVLGRCTADVPWSGLAQVLAALLGPLPRDQQAALIGPDATLLAAVWPGLTLPASQVAATSPDPAAIAQAFAGVLRRAAPIAVVVLDLDRADPGTVRALPALAQSLPDNVRIWATASRPGFGLRTVLPPRWTSQAEHEVLSELLPSDVELPPTPAPTPLQGCARAWRAMAVERGLPGPADPPLPGAVALAVLDQPFPRSVAEALTPDVRELLAAGVLRVQHLDEEEDQDTRTVPRGREALAFPDASAHALARADPQGLGGGGGPARARPPGRRLVRAGGASRRRPHPRRHP